MDVRPLVLCVEDEPLMLKCLGRLLRRFGAEACSASNGQEALELLERMDPLPDLVITDLVMPVLGGEELLEALRRDPALASIPVVAISGLRPEAPFDLFIAKPFEAEELRLALQLTPRGRRRWAATPSGGRSSTG